jgi:tetratricopeptide (TPR) repeat protein
VKEGRQVFEQSPFLGPPYGTTILYAGPDTAAKESALKLSHDGGEELTVYLPPMKAGARVWVARDGCTYGIGSSAIGRCDSLQASGPYNEFHYLLGLIYRTGGDLKAAGNAAEYHRQWGYGFLLEGLFAQGEKELRRAIEIDEGNSDSRVHLAALYLKQRRYAEAIREAKVAASLRPEDPIPVNDLGVIYASRGLFNEAEREFLRAMEINKKYSTPCRNLAVLYKRRGVSVEQKFWAREAGILEASQHLEDGLMLGE